MAIFKSRRREIEPAEAAERHGSGRLALIDVRRPEERRAGCIAGSLHIPLDELPDRLGELPHDTPLAFVCRLGMRSQKAAGIARDAGRPALSMRGGMTAWTGAGLPTAHSGCC
jgi:rhodanese-related sulfurtransferase